jgi:phosphatidylinositol-3-phosphatase
MGAPLEGGRASPLSKSEVLMLHCRARVMGCVFAILTTAVTASCEPPQDQSAIVPTTHHIKTVFVIVMENHNWTGDGSYDIKDNPDAPYINYDLIPNGAHANNYWNPLHEHPSLGNYLWMEAGTDFGINGDLVYRTVKQNTQFTTEHLVHQLSATGRSWKAYSGKSWPYDTCPVYNWGVPQVFFNDVTDDASPTAPVCIAHVRPMSELAPALKNGTAPDYSFIVPNLCDSMHTGCDDTNPIRDGDDWLRANVRLILNSKQYKEGGALFIVFDEARYGDGPIPMIVMSPFAKPGYGNDIHYTHGSLLRTVEEIFSVPLLRNANYEPDLSNLFSVFP